jgi:hypothetical protein
VLSWWKINVFHTPSVEQFCLRGRCNSNGQYINYQVVEKVIFPRLFKNIQMQGTRNPEE